MKRHSAISLCLASLLPCIIGIDDCTCTFPDYLSGTDSNEDRSYSFFMSFPDKLLKRNGSDIQVFDFNKMVGYEVLPSTKLGCNDETIIGMDYYTFVPSRCVPKDAQNVTCPSSASNSSDVQCYNATTYHIQRTYVVTNVKDGKCMPITIVSSIEESDGTIISNTLTDIMEDSAKDLDFYTYEINNLGAYKCSDDIVLG